MFGRKYLNLQGINIIQFMFTLNLEIYQTLQLLHLNVTFNGIFFLNTAHQRFDFFLIAISQPIHFFTISPSLFSPVHKPVHNLIFFITGIIYIDHLKMVVVFFYVKNQGRLLKLIIT